MPIPLIDELPVAPSRGDPPALFNERADAFVGAQGPMVIQTNASIGAMNELAGVIDGQAIQVANDRGIVLQAKADALASALSALNAPGTNATSITELVIGVGPRTFTMQPSKAYILGQQLLLTSAASPANRMSGFLSAYNSVTGLATVQIEDFSGGGTFNSWLIGLTASSNPSIATPEEIWAGNDNNKVVTAAGMVAANLFQTLADAATITWDTWTQGWHAKVVLGGNRTLALPTNLREGQTYVLQVIQPSVSPGRTLILPGAMKFGLAGTPVLSTTANAIDIIRFQVINPTTYLDAQFKKAA